VKRADTLKFAIRGVALHPQVPHLGMQQLRPVQDPWRKAGANSSTDGHICHRSDVTASAQARLRQSRRGYIRVDSDRNVESPAEGPNQIRSAPIRLWRAH